jgi:hypothetical protein
MSDLPRTTHDIFNKPGDEGSAPTGIDKEAEEHNVAIPTPSHDHVMTPGTERSFKLGVNDPSYQQGYLCTPIAIKAPNYVGPGGPHVDQTHVPAADGSNPTPDMPGA